ncbi:hypothetical protein HY218_00140 [Candidatus Saccharibacteria bacterium]|nr:hypothetical protein [Candidatus Saccharibacteria bacterium]
MWQDKVIAICQAGFVIALIPSIRSDDKPALKSSIMSIILVAIITFSLATLHLWLSVLTASGIEVCWVILAIQKAKDRI